jgi:tetratricopeptide (TPR) repeat protein
MSEADKTANPAATALAAYLGGDRALAERLYGEALARNASDAAAHQGLGVLRFEQGRKVEAVELLGAAARLAPDNAGIRRNHAAALAVCERFAQAADEYRAALRIEPAAADWGRLGSVLAELDRNEEAIAAYETALAKLPAEAADRPALYRRLGRVQRDAGQTEAAIGSWQAALALAPGHAGVHFNLGNALKSLGRHAEAEAAYRRALAIEPGLLRAQVNLGAVLRDEGRLEEAEAAFRAALEADPRSADARRNLAIVLHDLNRSEEALHALEPLLAAGAEERATLEIAAMLFQTLHRHAEALAVAEQLLMIDPGDGGALGARAGAAGARARRGSAGGCPCGERRGARRCERAQQCGRGLAQLGRFRCRHRLLPSRGRPQAGLCRCPFEPRRRAARQGKARRRLGRI